MGYRIKPGNQIMQKGKIFTQGCVLDFVDKDLMSMVDVVEGKQTEYQEVMHDGIPIMVDDLKNMAKHEKPVTFTTDQIINMPDAMNPLLIEKAEEEKKGPGRPKKD